MVFVRSYGCPGFTLPLFDFAQLGSSMLLRSSSQPAFSVAIHGLVRSDSLPSAVDVANADLLVLPRSLAQASSAVLLPGFSAIGSSTLLRNPACPEPPLLLSGWARVFGMLSVQAAAEGGTILLVFSDAIAGSLVFVLNDVNLGMALLAKSSCRPGLAFSVFAMTAMGPFLSLHQFACLNAAVPVPGASRAGFIVPAAGAAHIDSGPPLRSLARLDFAPLALSFAKPGSPLPLRQPARLSSAVSVLGPARPGFTLLAVDSSHAGAASPPRSTSHPGFSVPVLQLAHVDSIAPLQSHAIIEPKLPVCGVMEFRVAEKLSVIGSCELGSASLARSSFHSGSSLPVPGFATPGFSLPLQQLTCPASFLSLSGMSWVGASLPSCATTDLGGVLLVFGGVNLGSTLLASGCGVIGSSLLLHSFAQTALSMSVFRVVTSGSLLLLQSLA